MKINSAILNIAIIGILAVGIIFLIQKERYNSGILGDVHDHADFKVYLDGNLYNFSQGKYMSSGNNTLSNFFHLHDMDGNVMHKHMAGVNLEFFFNTLKMKFNSTCFITDNENKYCNDRDKNIKMYVNGMRNYDYENYEFKDLDRILITYGNENEEEIKNQIGSVTDDACIYSKKCPERGSPPDETSCLGNACVIE